MPSAQCVARSGSECDAMRMILPVLLVCVGGVLAASIYICSAQFIAVCRRSQWSKDRTPSPLRALRALVGSQAAPQSSLVCSQAC